MKISRAILSGVLVWILIFVSFSILHFIPVVKDSLLEQSIIIFILILPFAAIGASFYYQKGSEATSGLTLGSIMVTTGFLLDAFITVPFLMIPAGGSYVSFFTDPFLYVFAIELIAVVFFYWKTKVKTQTA